MKEISVLCNEQAVDSKCGYNETLNLYYTLGEKYKISLIVPRKIDIYNEKIATPYHNVCIYNIVGNYNISDKNNNIYSHYKIMNEDKLLQNKLWCVAKNSDLIICHSIYHVLLARNTFPNKTIIYRSLDVDYDKVIWYDKYTVETLNCLQDAFNFEKEACEAADYIVTLTEDDSKRLCELYNLPESKIISTIPICFVNATLNINYVPKKKNIEVSKGVFISAASISEPDKFVECMSKLPEIEFHIIGNCCYDIDNWPDNVIIHGKVNDVEKEKIINECDFAINISKMSFGMNAKNIEYFSLGIPVIANKLGVRGYNVVPEKEFILSNWESFTDDIKRFCKLSVDQRYDIALNAFNHICDEYNYKKYIYCFDNFIKEKSDEEILFYIFGAGIIGKKAIKHMNTHNIKCLGFVDNSIEKHGKTYCGVEIFSPKRAFHNIISSNNIMLLISANSENTMQIIGQSVPEIGADKIIVYNEYAVSIEDMKESISIDKLKMIGK